MNKRIRSMIDEIFSEMKMTAENLALRDELMANAAARFEDALSQGKTEEEAFAEVAASLEDVSDLLHDMNGAASADAQDSAQENPQAETAAEEAPKEAPASADTAPQTDLGDALNKAFSAIGSWGQSIMPQAKKLARQVDDATGGMLKDIGRAVNKGMQDAQKAANEVLDRLEKEKAAVTAEDASAEKTPDDLREDAKDLRAQADIKRAVGADADANALYAQAELLEAQADALEQAVAMEEAVKAAESEPQPEEAPKQPIFGADGELNEDAFAKSVDQMTREAENLVRGAGELIDEAIHGKRDPHANEVRFPAVGLRRIDVKLDADDVTIEPADGDEVIVRWAAQNTEGEPEVSLSNHTLIIRRKNPDVFKTFFSVFSKNGGQITVFVPRGYAADYVLSSTSGDIRLSGLDADNVKVSTTSGSVRVEPAPDVRASDVVAETISGSVTISAMATTIKAESISGNVFISCDAASVKGDVVSGSLHIEGACDDLDVDAVSGSIELVCTVVPSGKIKIDTISGGAKLYLPGSIRGFSVDFDSMGGSLRNEFGPDRYGTCTLPIHIDTISGKMIIARL